SHAGDHCIMVPVLDDEGRHRATALVKAHMADIGNAEPTTMTATARDVYEEGALIFNCVKVQEDYRDVEDVIRMCQTRIRVPEDWYGDFMGMIGAARVGERELQKVGEEVGWDVFDGYVEDWLDYSEERIRATIKALPAGRRTGYDLHDSVPLPGVEEGVQMEVTVEVDPERGEIEIDLRSNPDCLPCGLNLTESTSTTSALIGVFNSIDHTVPRNSGSARAIRVLLRDNCCVGVPVHLASCSLTTGETNHGGSMMRDSPEVLELLPPIRVWADRIVCDTGGDGRFRGAPSLYVEYGPVDTQLEVFYAADGTVTPALGARGGEPGALLRPFMRPAAGEVVELDPWGHVILEPGETIISISSAGGGYGPTVERDPEHVRHDVAEGWITEQRALETYGVVLAADGSVDLDATAARRAGMGDGAAGSSSVRSPVGKDPVLRL